MIKFDEAKALYDYDRAIQPKMAVLCEPLKLLGISNFSYARVTKEQKLLRIGNYTPYTDLFYKLELYNHPSGQRGFANRHTFEQEKQTKFFLWNMDNIVPGKLRLSVNMWNGVTIYATQKDYFEAYAFGGTPTDTSLPNFLINNQDVLMRFVNYFKTEGRDLIDMSDDRKTLSVEFHDHLDNSYLWDQEKLSSFVERLATNKYFLNTGHENFRLTIRELECLLFKNQGLSAKEMARLMGISHRTVESYFENIKVKSGLGNINQVLDICRDEGLL